MLPVWAEVILAWLALGCVLNVLGFTRFYIKYLNKTFNQERYDEGYNEAMTNITTFCNKTGEFPSQKWVLSAMNKKLETEHDLLEHGIETKDNRSINSNYYFR